jgi:type IV pilus assembly protein PilW
MSRNFKGTYSILRGQAGLSLIELMIALVIAALLTLGITQIFIGSKVAYQVQEGLSRIQENGRFSLQYLERNVRLAGYMGCGSDIVRVAPNDPANANYPFDTRFINHLVKNPTPTVPSQYRFQRPIEGFNANTVPVDQALALGAAADWTPQLPAALAGKVVKGSDVLILRIFGEESTPVVGFFSNAGTFQVADPNFVKAGGIYGIENCGATPTYGFSEIFQATTSAAGNITATLSGANVLTVPSTPTQTWNHGIGFTRPSGSQINASVHVARYLAIYVGLRDEADGVTKTPALYVSQFPDGGILPAADELADNVENMQLQFGRDTTVPRDDTVDDFKTADQVIAGIVGDEAQDSAWQQVINVRIGLLIRGQNPDSGTSHDGAYQVGGTVVNPVNDHRLRQVYETTIALRNRIFNS